MVTSSARAGVREAAAISASICTLVKLTVMAAPCSGAILCSSQFRSSRITTEGRCGPLAHVCNRKQSRTQFNLNEKPGLKREATGALRNQEILQAERLLHVQIIREFGWGRPFVSLACPGETSSLLARWAL